MLPPKPKFTNPLKLKSVLIAGESIGYDGLITNVLKNHAMERILLDECSDEFISNEKFSEFIASLPQTGSQLKFLDMPAKELDRESLDCIFESCVNLEELHMEFCFCMESADYLSTLGCQIDEYTRLFGTKET